MNPFKSIGFPVETVEDGEAIARRAMEKGGTVKTPNSTYVRYQDPSGAEIWLLLGKFGDVLDINPHFAGKSRRLVCLTNTVGRQGSEMDGAFYCWAEPEKENDPKSGLYPFVFDVPDMHTMGTIAFPRNCEMQMTAFAHDMRVHDNEKEFDDSQIDQVKFASFAFVPTGLFSQTGHPMDTMEAFGTFAGKIKDFELKNNELTGLDYYWMLVETYGGEVDVVSDPAILNKRPILGGIAFGDFWLSGRLIDPPPAEKPKGFFDKLFGRH